MLPRTAFDCAAQGLSGSAAFPPAFQPEGRLSAGGLCGAPLPVIAFDPGFYFSCHGLSIPYTKSLRARGIASRVTGRLPMTSPST
jgi:hypothetical protein